MNALINAHVITRGLKPGFLICNSCLANVHATYCEVQEGMIIKFLTTLMCNLT